MNIHDKIDGKLKPSDEHRREYLRRCYKDLLVGPPPSPELRKKIFTTDFQKNSLIVCSEQTGAMKACALVLMRMGISSFRVFNTHYLVEVFVNNSEDDASLSTMWAPFFVLMHGFIKTPNRRLNDLILEFIEHQTISGNGFLMFSVDNDISPFRPYFDMKGLKIQGISPDYARNHTIV